MYNLLFKTGVVVNKPNKKKMFQYIVRNYYIFTVGKSYSLINMYTLYYSILFCVLLLAIQNAVER